MELEDANAGFAVHEAMKENLASEIETIHDTDLDKTGRNEFTPEQEKRLVRKLDLW